MVSESRKHVHGHKFGYGICEKLGHEHGKDMGKKI